MEGRSRAARAAAALAGVAQRNWFILGILLVVTLGLVASETGRRLNPDSITTSAIVLVQFLILGFTVPTESVVRGLAGWRFHVVVQVAIFAVVPLFFVLTSLPLRGILGPGLMTGVMALAVLPTTVSSCVVFTQVAGGNVAAALFNSALSNAVGVLLSPLLLSLLLSGAGQGLPREQMLAVFVDLAGRMLAPAAVGQLLRLGFAGFADRNRRRFGVLANSLVLVTVFFAVSKSAGNPAFSSGLARLALPFAYLACAHLALVALAWAAGGLLRLDHEDRVAMLFVVPQKTLVMGVPLLGIYFARNPEMLGIAVLPLLFYHPFQLLTAGFARGIVRRGG